MLASKEDMTGIWCPLKSQSFHRHVMPITACLQHLSELAHAQVALKPLAASEVTAACSTLADMGFVDLAHGSEERQRRVTLRIAVEDVALGLQDVRLLRNCLPVPE